MDPARRQTIHEAMVRLSDGDRAAFPVLLEELWPVILSFAQRERRRASAASARSFLLLGAAISLAVFAWLLSFHPTAGRAYAA